MDVVLPVQLEKLGDEAQLLVPAEWSVQVISDPSEYFFYGLEVRPGLCHYPQRRLRRWGGGRELAAMSSNEHCLAGLALRAARRSGRITSAGNEICAYPHPQYLLDVRSSFGQVLRVAEQGTAESSPAKVIRILKTVIDWPFDLVAGLSVP